MALRKDEFHSESEEQSVERAKLAKEQQIVISISSKLYNRIEAEAHQHNQSLSDYVEDVLEQALPNEETGLL